MPLAKIHVLEGQYDKDRLAKLSTAVREAMIDVMNTPADELFQIIFALPRDRFLHTRSFLGLNYSDDFMVLEINLIAGRPPKETRLALLAKLNARIVAATGISPDDVMIWLIDIAGPENLSFGRGLAQRNT